MSGQYELNAKSRKKDHGVIVIYQRPNFPNWQTRIKINGSVGYIRKSTKSSSEIDAWIFCEKLYEEKVEKFKATGSVKSKPFKKVVTEWLNQLKNEKAEQNLIDDFDNCINRYALKHWGNTSIDTIDDAEVQAFIDWRKTKGRTPPTDSTLKRDMVAVKKLFAYAFAHKYIKEIPSFPKFNAKSERRANFTDDEWKKIVKSVNHWLKEAENNNPNAYRNRLYLKYFILIIGNTGIRPGTETQNLSWKCFFKGKVEGQEKKRLFIRVLKGKTGSRTVAPSTPVNSYKNALLKFRKKELKELKKTFDENEPIFCHKNGKPILSFKKGFKSFLKEYNLLKNKDGEKRVPYSLRHTYATRMIHSKMSHMFLAMNMGTSVKMLEKHYVHGDPYEYGSAFMDVEVPLISR